MQRNDSKEYPLLISMMYHHVNSDRCSNKLPIFEKHLEYIKNNFTSTFPQQNLPKKAICLVFDDGYYDFYRFIFPLLKKYNLKAVLAVVPKYILESCDEEDTIRLNHEHNHLFQNYEKGTFCTYEELKEMIQSGLLQVASHSYSHVNLLDKDIDLEQELLHSKEVLEEKLNIKVESFVYPFGKYDQNILNETKKHYQYSFRIGNAINKDFTGVNGVIYRIDGDNLNTASEIFSFKNMIRFHIKSIIKKIVGNR